MEEKVVEADIAIIDYAKARYDEEQKRFEIIEQKATKLLSLMSALLASFILLSSVVFDGESMEIHLEDPIDWMLVINGIIIFVCFVSSWGHALSCIKTDDCPTASIQRENIDYLIKHKGTRAVKQIVECYTVGAHELIEFNDLKSRKLDHSYNELKSSMFFIVLHTLLAFGATI